MVGLSDPHRRRRFALAPVRGVREAFVASLLAALRTWPLYVPGSGQKEEKYVWKLGPDFFLETWAVSFGNLGRKNIFRNSGRIFFGNLGLGPGPTGLHMSSTMSFSHVAGVTSSDLRHSRELRKHCQCLNTPHPPPLLTPAAPTYHYGSRTCPALQSGRGAVFWGRNP